MKIAVVFWSQTGNTEIMATARRSVSSLESRSRAEDHNHRCRDSCIRRAGS